MVIGHVLPEKNESLLEAYEKCRSAADSKTCCDYALHVGVTWWGPKVPLQGASEFLKHHRYEEYHFLLCSGFLLIPKMLFDFFGLVLI